MKLLALLPAARLETPRDLLTWLTAMGLGAAALLPLGVPGLACIAVGTAGATMITGFWWWNRRLPRFAKRGELGVIVAMNCGGTDANSAETEAVLQNLIEHLSTDAQNALPPGPNKIIVRTLPKHVVIGSQEAGRVLLQKTRAAYVLWASGTAGRAEREVAFGRISFAVRHRPLDETVQQHFETALGEISLMPADYRVRLDHEIADTRLVSLNLALISKYHLGLAAAASGWREIALHLLLTAVGDGVHAFQKRARREIVALYVLFWLSPDRWPTPATLPAVRTTALADADAALALEPTNATARLLRAACLFSAGDVVGSRRENDSIRDAVPVAFNLNRAVYALARGEFDAALAAYKKVKSQRFGGPTQMTGLGSTAAAWLRAAVDNLSPNYLFGLAFVTDELGESDVALASYRQVLPSLGDGTRARAYAEQRIRALSPNPTLR